MGQKTSRLHLHPRTMKELQQQLDNEITDEDILSWYDDYTKYLPKGKKSLNRESFFKVYNTMFSGDATAFADQVFSTFDVDNNGEVDFREFIVGLYTSGSKNTDKKLKWAFKMYDIDKDGYITREEMNYVIEAILKMTHGTLPEEYHSPKHMTDVIFDKLDNNKDNKLCEDEFIEGAQQIKVIVDILEPSPTDEDDFTDIADVQDH